MPVYAASFSESFKANKLVSRKILPKTCFDCIRDSNPRPSLQTTRLIPYTTSEKNFGRNLGLNSGLLLAKQTTLPLGHARLIYLLSLWVVLASCVLASCVSASCVLASC